MSELRTLLHEVKDSWRRYWFGGQPREREVGPIDYREWAAELVDSLSRERQWALRQALADPARYYGGDGTIHNSTKLIVHVGMRNDVVAVWYRCVALPYEVREVSVAQPLNPDSAILGLEILD